MEGNQNFADYIASERARLSADRESIFTQQHDLETKLAAVNSEMKAIDAYEAAKSGKTMVATRNGSNDGTRGRARRGSRREEITNAVREAGTITRGELIERLGVKGDKSGEMSISNALTALTKAGQLARNGRQYVFQNAA